MMNIDFEAKAWAKMQTYRAIAAKKLKTEIAGLGKIARIDGIPTVIEVCILKQQVSATEAEIDETALEAFCMAPEWPEYAKGMLHWHVHPGKSVRPSMDDVTQYSQMRELMRGFAALILSNKGDDYHLEGHVGGHLPVDACDGWIEGVRVGSIRHILPSQRDTAVHILNIAGSMVDLPNVDALEAEVTRLVTPIRAQIVETKQPGKPRGWGSVDAGRPLNADLPPFPASGGSRALDEEEIEAMEAMGIGFWRGSY